MREEVRCWLSSQAPLTVLSLGKLYGRLAQTDKEKDAIRAALYGLSVGNKVAKTAKTMLYYAIKIEINRNEYYFSLPGILKKNIIEDNAELRIKNIKNELSKKYGKEVVDYWVTEAQYRSVGIAQPAMKRVKERDTMCKLCKFLGFDKKGRAHHIISRRYTFWTTLESVESKYSNRLFSDESTREFIKQLKLNKCHSDENYIIMLCEEHDQLLKATLQDKVSTQEKLHL